MDEVEPELAKAKLLPELMKRFRRRSAGCRNVSIRIAVREKGIELEVNYFSIRKLFFTANTPEKPHWPRITTMSYDLNESPAPPAYMQVSPGCESGEPLPLILLHPRLRKDRPINIPANPRHRGKG